MDGKVKTLKEITSGSVSGTLRQDLSGPELLRLLIEDSKGRDTEFHPRVGN